MELPAWFRAPEGEVVKPPTVTSLKYDVVGVFGYRGTAEISWTTMLPLGKYKPGEPVRGRTRTFRERFDLEHLKLKE